MESLIQWHGNIWCPIPRIKWPKARKQSQGIYILPSHNKLQYLVYITEQGLDDDLSLWKDFHFTEQSFIFTIQVWCPCVSSTAWKPRQESQDRKEKAWRTRVVPKVTTPVKPPLPQTCRIHHVLMIFKIDQSKQKAEALKHLWNTFPSNALSNYKYIALKNSGKLYLQQKPTREISDLNGFD